MQNIEEKIQDFLKNVNEFAFRKGEDVDYTFTNKVIVFTKDEKYREEGKTHELVSHSIKHLLEFNPGSTNHYLKKLREMILKAEERYIIDKRNNEYSFDSNIPNEILLNTLDRVNDKVVMGEKLLPIEKEISDEILKRFASEYTKIIARYLDNSIDVDKMKSKEILTLLHDGKTIKYTTVRKTMTYVNIKDSVFMSTEDNENTVRTLFKMSDNKGYIQRQMTKTKPINNDVRYAISQL